MILGMRWVVVSVMFGLGMVLIGCECSTSLIRSVYSHTRQLKLLTYLTIIT